MNEDIIVNLQSIRFKASEFYAEGKAIGELEKIAQQKINDITMGREVFKVESIEFEEEIALPKKIGLKTRFSWKNLQEMYSSQEFQMFESDELLNPQYHMLSSDYDIDVDNMIECNEEGMRGVSHSAVIYSWRKFLKNLRVFDPEYDDEEFIDKHDITQSQYDKIEREINKCEEWHEKNGSLGDIT